MFVKIYHRQASEFDGRSNLPSKVPNFEILLPAFARHPLDFGNRQLPVPKSSDVQLLLPDLAKMVGIRHDLAGLGQNPAKLACQNLATATRHCLIPAAIAGFYFSLFIIFSYELTPENIF
jgi:hypothetical protein